MSEKILEISNLFVSYPGKDVIVNFSMNLGKGEKIIISGPNGCGKTTLLKCVLGIHKGYSGKISVLTDNIAYCKQDFPNNAFPLSAKEVVEMGLYKRKQFSKEKIIDSMKKTDTLHLADRAFFSLSGGERQRVSLARCFCQDADLLLFDEPSSFLDRESLDSFANLMKNLPAYISAIVVTHDPVLSEKLGWKDISLEKGESK